MSEVSSFAEMGEHNAPRVQAARTVLELVATPVITYVDAGPGQPNQPPQPNPRPFRTTQTQQRTFDEVNRRPDSRPDINQE